jgi:hypothetical protein
MKMPRRSAAQDGLTGIFAEAVKFLNWRAKKDEAEKYRVNFRNTVHQYLVPDEDNEKIVPDDVRVDEDGHRHLEFKAPVEVNGVKYAGVVDQRRVSSYVDLEKVKAFFQPDEEAREELDDLERARRWSLQNRVYKPVDEYYWDLEHLYVMVQQGLLTEDELDSLCTTEVTWALNVEKHK